ncbi:hypothetical protein AB0I28_33710 [Phytomonospora sp. NPDC050363]|uniref:hypothetical protein n=1 Tax=Phytomonospora sp. NPDC050363 TaxID=3155642 RepID=UPI0033E97FC6
MKLADMVEAKPFADPAVPVLPWPEGRAAPALPPGHGGISVRTWNNTRWDYNRPARPRAVGIDDRPLWHGYGRMVAVVAPGQHLVEVRRDHVEGSRLVEVAAGELVELEYAAPHGFALDGVLTAPPSRIVGTTLRPWLLFLVFLAATPVVLSRSGASESLGGATAAVSAGLILAGLLVTIAWQVGVRRRGERYRAEAADEPRPVTTASGTGVLLGHTPRRIPAAQAGRAGLLIDARLAHTVRMNGFPVESSTSPHGWAPRPRLWIDGREHPVSWAHWWYMLAPGTHEIRFEVPGPALAAGAPGCEPARTSLNVEVPDGSTRRLRMDVEARTEVQPVRENYDDASLVDVRARLAQSYQDWEAPTAVAGFTAETTPAVD